MADIDDLKLQNKALASLESGYYSEAERLFSQLCRQNPGSHFLQSVLGKALMGQNKYHEAGAALEAALRLKPDSIDVLMCLVSCYMKLGQLDSAITATRRIIDIEPDNVYARINLGKICFLSGRHGDAIDALTFAISRDPSIQESHVYLCNALILSERLVEAVNCLERAKEIWPNNAELASALAMSYYRLGLIEDAFRICGEIIEKHPAQMLAHSAYIYSLCYLPGYDPEYKFKEHVRWGKRHAPVGAMQTIHNNDRSRDRPLRVGYLSPDLRTHSVAFFLQPILEHHDRYSIQTYCYSNVEKADKMTVELQQLADNWREIRHLDDAHAAGQVQADEIDILIDLTGHTAGGRPGVFARKPAPVQAAYIGYPASSGMCAMDYKITDEWADPPGVTDHLYTETLLRIPHGFLCYQPQTDAAVSSAPCFENGYTTFGSFNNLAKVNGELVDAWCSLLKQSPGSRLLLKSKGLQYPEVRERTSRLFDERGIDRGRIELSGWAETLDNHLDLYRKVDIALDTFPYNGTTTSCEALWMGVPVITLAGKEHAGRVGVSLLTQAGLTELIANSKEEYIELARVMAMDSQGLSALRGSLRNSVSASSLCDPVLTTRDIETTYRSIWRKWLEHTGSS